MKIPLFDIDGTLFKSGNPVKRQAYSYAFKIIYGIEAQITEINPEGLVDNQIIVDVMKLHGISEEEIKGKIKEATTAMSQYFDENKDKVKIEILRGVIDLLESLREKGDPIGLLTGNVEKLAWTRMEIAGIIKFFDFGAFGDQAFLRTDLVEIARNNASKVFGKEYSIDNFVIVGDTPRDIICARDTGIGVIAIPSGFYSYEELEKEKPDLLVKTLEEKDKILEFLNN